MASLLLFGVNYYILVAELWDGETISALYIKDLLKNDKQVHCHQNMGWTTFICAILALVAGVIDQ
jgi:hypothetical protein